MLFTYVMLVKTHMSHLFVYCPDVSTILYSYTIIIKATHKVAVQLIQIAPKKEVFSHQTSFDFLKAHAVNRLDIHNTAINDTIKMTFDSIDNDFILLSCDHVTRSLGESNRHCFDYIAKVELDPDVGGELLLYAW